MVVALLAGGFAGARSNPAQPGAGGSGAGAHHAARLTSATAAAGEYVPLSPVRLIDTRHGTSYVSRSTALHAGETWSVGLENLGGIPASGVLAVNVDVAVVPVTTGPGYLRVWPSDHSPPATSLLDYASGATVDNMAMVQVSSSGQLSFYSDAGDYNLVVDLAGYVTSGSTGAAGASYVPLTESRIIDTRYGTGGYTGTVGTTGQAFLVAGQGGVPPSAVSAVVLAVGVTGESGAGFLTVWPDGTSKPATSSMNYGTTSEQRTITVPVGSDGKIKMAAGAGTTYVYADVYGYYLSADAAGAGSVFVPVNQSRLLDTRNTGTPAAGSTTPLPVTGVGGLPASGVTAVLVGLTSLNTVGSGFVTAFADGTARPSTSALDTQPGRDESNQAIVAVGSTGKIDLYTATQTDLMVDLYGYFQQVAPILSQPDTVHADGADLHWTAYAATPSAPFDSYRLYRSTNPTFTPSAATLLTTIADASVTAFSDTTAAPNTSFTYKLVVGAYTLGPVTVTTPADGQAVKVLQPDASTAQNTYLWSDTGTAADACVTTGASPDVKVGSYQTGLYRTLVGFNLRDIPATATITSATLALYAQQDASSQAATVEVHRVTRTWKAGSGSDASPACSGDGATWNDAAGGAVRWTSPGGDYDATVAASVTKPANAPAGTDSFNLTSLVGQWVSGSQPDLGVLVKTQTEPTGSGNKYVQYAAAAAATASQRPQLTVDYSDASHPLAPSVAMSTPAPGAVVSGTTTLTAGASDDGTVDHVDFLVDGSVIGTATAAPYTRSWDTTTAGPGPHSLTVRAVDTAGNSTTSAAVTVTVDNTAGPTVSLTAPTSGATVNGSVTVSATAAASGPDSVARVDFYVNQQLIGTATSSPYTISWDSLSGTVPVYDGTTYSLTAKATDSSGRSTTSAPVTFTTNNTAGTMYQASFSGVGTLPTSMVYDPSLQTQPTVAVPVTVTNTSGHSWTKNQQKMGYSWWSGHPAQVAAGAVDLTNNLANNGSQSFTLNVAPPSLPDGVDQGDYLLRLDMQDATTSPTAWFAQKGSQPAGGVLVHVIRKNPIGLGLQKYYRYDTHPLGGGMISNTNVASGNLALNLPLFTLPGRGVSSVAALTYNSLEDPSDTPAGNGFSLAISGLTRFGTPLDIHPNNADTIAGQSNKWVGVTDGSGGEHTFTGTTNPDGTTTWTAPAGVDLYLRSATTDTNSPQYWALSRPDHVTFYYNQAGWPTSVVDKNGNTLTFTETAPPAGQDPGAPGYQITQVTDPGGRAVTISYYDKTNTDNARQRGRIQDIADHLGRVWHFDYYDDGNLLRLTQRGGTNVDGSFLPDRSWVFTYLTSDGSAPAIANPADRVSPDPKTSNEDSQIYSVRDPDGRETLYGYYPHSAGPALSGRAQTLTDRAGHATTYTYDTTNLITTVTDPLTHATTYTYDTSGRVTAITNAKSETTSIAWSTDNEVAKITEANGTYTTYSYNANGYLTDRIDQAGDHTALTYNDLPLDGTDTGTHWSLLATKTTPNGVAAGSGYQWQFGYDTAGDLITATDPLGHQATYCYNLAVAPACNPNNDPNSPGTLEAETDFNGHVTTLSNYEPNGNPQTVTDPMGRVSQYGFDADGNQVFTQDPLHYGATGSDVASYRTYFAYDSFNRLGRTSTPKSTSLARGLLIFTDTSYDPNGNLTGSQDAHYGFGDGNNGATTTHQYDVMDRPTLTTGPDTAADPAGQRTQTVYDAAGNIASQTLPLGVQSGVAKDHTTSYTYNALNQVSQQTQYTVTSSGAIVDTRSSFSCYDNTGNQVTVTAPNAQLTSSPCPSSDPPTCPAVAPAAYTTISCYDAAHRLISVTDPLGHKTARSYDNDSNVQTSTDANGSVTTNTYDQKDQLVKTVAPFIHGGRTTTTQYAYDPDGNKTQDIPPRAVDSGLTAGPNGCPYYATCYGYDADNEKIREQTPSDATTQVAYIYSYYNPDGQQIGVSLPVTTYDPTADPNNVSAAAKTVFTLYDTGWVAASKDPATPTVHFDYTAQGWQTSRIPDNPAGGLDNSLAQHWTYTPGGNTATYTDAGGQASAYHYNADDLLSYAKTAHGVTSPDQAPIEIYADYSGYDQLAATHYRPTSGTTYLGTSYPLYDHDGNVVERDDNAQQNLTVNQANSAGVPISWTVTQTAPPDVNTLSYDGADWLVNQYDKGTTNTCNQRIHTTWTPTGWETSREIATTDTGCTPTSIQQSTAWTYNDNGKLATDKITNRAGTVLETHIVGYTVPNGSSTIYLDGNRSTDQYALNGPGSTTCTGSTPTCTATYTYDARDRLLETNDGHGPTVACDDGTLNTTCYSFDQNNSADNTIRAGNITTQKSGASTTTSTYKGNQQTSTTTGGATTYNWYDPLGRLNCVTTVNNASGCNTITTGGSGVSAAVLKNYSYDFMDRFTATHTYNGSGTLTDQATYNYDALDRTAQEVETHTSGNLNRTTTFNYLGLSNNVTQEAEQNTGGTTNTDTKTYNYDAYGHRITLNDTTTSNNTTTSGTYTYGYDVHGDASLLVDQATGNPKASYGYAPYGTLDTTLSQGDTSLTTPFNPYRYSAQRFDSGSQTYNVGGRRFDPTTQRFLQLDQYQGALADLGLATDPLTQNRYDLGNSNPLSGIDYSGHCVADPGYNCAGTPVSPPATSGSSSSTPTPPPPSNSPPSPGSPAITSYIPTESQAAPGQAALPAGSQADLAKLLISIASTYPITGQAPTLGNEINSIAAQYGTYTECEHVYAGAHVCSGNPGTSAVTRYLAEGGSAKLLDQLTTQAGSGHQQAAAITLLAAFGIQLSGPETGDNVVYRALREGENPDAGLTARAPEATDVSPLSHVAGKQASPWISTSKSLETVMFKYDSGNGIVSIDLNKVGSEILDLSGGIPGGGRFSNYAAADQEVLIRGFVPSEAIVDWWP